MNPFSILCGVLALLQLGLALRHHLYFRRRMLRTEREAFWRGFHEGRASAGARPLHLVGSIYSAAPIDWGGRQ